MSAESSGKSIEIVGDDDWKERVKAEDAARDAEIQAAQAAAAAAETDASSEQTPPEPEPGPSRQPRIKPDQVPLASFPLIVSMFSTQAMTALGLLPHPSSGKQEIEPVLAKHYIDLLGVIETKTKGNLEAEEARMLTETVHQLRMVFVQLNASSAKK